MKFAACLTLVLTSALRIIGVALPITESNGTSTWHTDPVHADDDGALDGGFVHPFTPAADLQVLCASGGSADTGTNYARTADCEEIGGVWGGKPGYWDISGWDTTVAQSLSAIGTCSFRLSRADGKDGHVWLGNQDVAQTIGQATAGFSHGGLIGVMGSMTCSHPDGDVELAWSIMA